MTNSSDKAEFKKTYTLPRPPTAFALLYCTPSPEGVDGNELYAKQTYNLRAHYIHPSCPKPIYDVSIRQPSGYTLSKVWLQPESIDVEFHTPGTYDIVVKITNAPEAVEYTKTYIVTEPRRVRISGPSEIKLGEFYNFTLSYEDPNVPNPEFEITVNETYFNDPNYYLTRNSNTDFTILFDDSGLYTIEARVKDRPDILIGKYYISLFSKPPYLLGERVVKNDENQLWEYSTPITIYAEDIPEMEIVQYRTVLYANVKINGAYLYNKNGRRQKIENFFLPDKIRATKTITLPRESDGLIDLPTLEDMKMDDPFVGGIILSPYYSSIFFPENYAREYKPSEEQ